MFTTSYSLNSPDIASARRSTSLSIHSPGLVLNRRKKTQCICNTLDSVRFSPITCSLGLSSLSHRVKNLLDEDSFDGVEVGTEQNGRPLTSGWRLNRVTEYITVWRTVELHQRGDFEQDALYLIRMCGHGTFPECQIVNTRIVGDGTRSHCLPHLFVGK